ncbi:MAG: AraC family transcriptional regulator [Clostridia bacterium]|nr:AraC family transcriptional regulator [Clostridia bacterium]
MAKTSLSQLCEALHFNKTHLERRFRKEMGVSAVAYLSAGKIGKRKKKAPILGNRSFYSAEAEIYRCWMI